MRPRVLLDIDGVCCNFVQPVVDEVNRLTGSKHTPNSVDQWDMMTALGATSEVAAAVDKMIKKPGFCLGLQQYAGAKSGVETLREFADVYPVTAPYDSTHWIQERKTWLVQELGFNKSDIVYTDAKHLITGDVLIDDKTATLVKWLEYHGPRNRAILYSQPWNKGDHWGGPRAVNWVHLVNQIKYTYAR